MNKIQEVKKRADILKIAQYFGLKLNRANKCICPFHKERTPSFSISPTKQIFHCFGCGVGGDCITLVSELLHISPYESAKQINDIFHIGINLESKTSKYELNHYKQIQEAKERFKRWENETFQLLCDYFHSLKGIEKYQEQDKIEYYIDLFIYGTNEDKLWFKKTNERWCKELERRFRQSNIRNNATI